jgi:hypothetical protein
MAVSKGRLSLIGEKNIEGAPELLLEILSEETEKRDRREKFSLYALSGVSESWIVDPESPIVQVFRLSGTKDFSPLDSLLRGFFPSWVIPSTRRSGLFPPPEEPSPPWRDRSIPTEPRTPKTHPCRAHLSFPALKGEVCRAIGSMPVRLTKRPERTRKRRHSCPFLSVHQTPGARVFFFRSFFCWDDRRERGKASAP